MTTKICKICTKELDIFNFYVRNINSNGIIVFRRECKYCFSNKSKENYQNNKVDVLKKSNDYYKNNKSKALLREKKYRQKNKIKIAIYQKNYAIKNKSKLNSYRKKYYSNKRIKRKLSINQRLRKCISASISYYLKRNNSSKNNQSINKYLNYSIEDLKKHLLSQFEPWMNWDNYGIYNVKMWKDNNLSTWTWQIDHIIPQSDLPYTSMNDNNFKKCWSLDNLRPYNSKQNFLDGITRVRHKGNINAL